MKSSDRTQTSHKTEIIIALIGLAGIVSTAVFSNWDRMFRDTEVVEVNYRPTQNFETELRHFVEVSGTRALVENMTQQLIQQVKSQLLEQEHDPADINALTAAITEEAITLDEAIHKFLPVYRKYFSLEELQELNRFYSTDIMQRMTAKAPLIAQDIAPLQMELYGDYERRLVKRLEAVN